MVMSCELETVGPWDTALIEAIQGGLPLVERPFAAVAAAIGVDEAAVLARLGELLASGTIKRLGVVVRHQELGYRANAMVVWDLPDAAVDGLGERIGTLPFVTLCYRRPRRLPDWPYNLFTMIHGRGREAVLEHVAAISRILDLGAVPHAVLFSGQRFKQRGAHYRSARLASETPGISGHGPDAASPRRPATRSVPVPLESGSRA